MKLVVDRFLKGRTRNQRETAVLLHRANLDQLPESTTWSEWLTQQFSFISTVITESFTTRSFAVLLGSRLANSFSKY